MAIVQILLAGFIGTLLMTAFSYLLSYTLNRQFKEPRLLNMFLTRAVAQPVPAITGWLIHFGIGFIFFVGYHCIWQYTGVEPSLLSGGFLGLGSGFIGITGWSFLFHIYDNPPPIDLKKYYIQLIIAHIIFGISGTAGYMIFGYSA